MDSFIRDENQLRISPNFDEKFLTDIKPNFMQKFSPISKNEIKGNKVSGFSISLKEIGNGLAPREE